MLRLLTSIYTLSLVLSGCAITCIDGQIPREPEPIDQVFIVELQFNDLQSMSRAIHCEKYYDTQCSERGNFWAVREVGFEKQYATSAFSFVDNEIGQVEIPVPSCTYLVAGKETPLSFIFPKFNDEKYVLKNSNGNERTYSTDWNGRKEDKLIVVNMMMRVDGVDLN